MIGVASRVAPGVGRKALDRGKHFAKNESRLTRPDRLAHSGFEWTAWPRPTRVSSFVGRARIFMMNEIVVPILLAAAGIVFILLGIKTLLRRNQRFMNARSKPTPGPAPSTEPSLERQDDAVYQGSKLVARAIDANVHPETREITFRELRNSDDLLLPEECEFRKYRIMIQRVEYASRIDKEDPEDGRLLRGVVAEILGYREQ